jgi:hypothetical protein
MKNMKGENMREKGTIEAKLCVKNEQGMHGKTMGAA